MLELVVLIVLDIVIPVVVGIVCIGVGLVLGKLIVDSKLKKANKTAEVIIETAKENAEKIKKEKISETKKEVSQIKHEADQEIRDRKRSVQEQENKVNQREIRLDNRSDSLDKREDMLAVKEKKLEDRKADIEKQYSKADAIVQEQEKKLNEIANLSQEKAREIIFERVENDMSMEIAAFIKDEEEKAKSEVNRKAKSLLVGAIQQYSSETVYETTVSVVALPNDEMKGRIIGREGRNIRAIEAATGVDIIIDDTPEAVVLSCFDPVRREIARRTMETLVQDGRIQPPRIEELVAKYQKELDIELKEAGEKAVFETGIGKIHPELVKLIGRLKYRTSYGQNVLNHSVEVAYIAGLIAAEVGADVTLARRAGLLHDIGKALTHEIEGSHVAIGVDIAKKYKENNEVIHAIEAHHGDVEVKTLIAAIVQAADAISAARPGARRENLQNYIKRLEKLEEIAKSFNGVDKCFAIQAGREIRIMVNPDNVSDDQTVLLARQIVEKIESELEYPGQIKVNCIRESRAVDYAK